MAQSAPDPKADSKSADKAAKKQPAKKPATRKSSPKTASSKTGKAAKPRAKSSSTPRKTKAANIQADLKSLETRLKRADTLTRNSVKSLETIVEALDARVKSGASVQKGQLTKHVNALSARLDTHMSDTRKLVRQELKAALSAGGLETLEDAISCATARLDDAELRQADAVTKINRHLADMARAVEQRLNDERDARRTDIESVTQRLSDARAQIEARVDTIERDSASALGEVGDKIERIHGKLEDKRQADADVVTEKVNELALQTQIELETYHDKLDARLSDLEARQKDSQKAHSVAPDLSDDLEALKQRLAQLEKDIAKGSRNPISDPPNAALPITAPIASQSTANDPIPFPTPSANPYASALSQASDNSLSSPSTEPVASHIPVEFDPRAYVPAQTVSPQPQPELRPQQQTAPAVVDSAVPDNDPIAQGHTVEMVQPAPPPMPVGRPEGPVEPDFEPAPLPDAPYANPAYAEAPDAAGSPLAVRVTEDGSKPGRKLPINGSAIRIAVLATGVAVVGLFAVKSLLDTGEAPNPQSLQQPTQTTASEPTSPSMTIVDPSEATTAPIGTYIETEPVVIDAAELDTLDAAVQAGDPIAQFQMGLAKLESGEMEAGTALIRDSANQGQPAALYRLAKLYESGTGVTADPAMARQLIERAARGGNRIAMHDLALYYAEGRGGVDLDMAAARTWFEEAAKRGVVDSQYNLAVLSESPDAGLQPDPETAFFWYSVAAAQGDQFAVQRRDTMAAQMNADVLTRLRARVEAFSPQPVDAVANGIFKDLPWIKTASPSAIPANAQVQEVQSLLSKVGYDVGSADGLMGSRTRAAIMAFERTNGLPETGRINDDLVSRLSLAAGV